MSDYTLNPDLKLTNPPLENLKQLKHFASVAHKLEVGKFYGIKNTIKDIQTIRRWGGYDSGLLEIGARRHPDRAALIDDDGALTYKELLNCAENFAAGLIAKGFGEGKNIAVLALNGRASIIPLLGRTMVGWNLFMFNANSSPKQSEAILDYHDIDLLIVDEEFYKNLLPETKKRPIVLGYIENQAEADVPRETIATVIDSSPGEELLPKNPASGHHVVMTSGTTGLPKGVVRRAHKSPQCTAPIIDALPLEGGQVWLLTAVLFHMYGYACLGTALATTSTIVTRRHFNEKEVLDIFKQYKVDIWGSAASRIRAVLSYMRDSEIEHYDGLKCILTSGSPLLSYEVEEASKRFGPVLVNFYGSTETSAIAITYPGELGNDPLISGHIAPGVSVKILGDDMSELPDGQIGKVYVRLFEFFSGYTDPKEKVPTHNGFYAMGDRGYKRGDKLYVLGRADDLVITQFGEKIQPSEIVDLLIRHPKVYDAYVLGVPDEDTGQALRAYVVPVHGVTLRKDKVCGYITENLTSAHKPRDVFFVKDLERTPTGKVISRNLPDKSTL